ncbi:MAG: extracellular solute-binding protein [Ardenticatenales bacterium]|nr:extracellular solute-binding protein [Ardenticatenales bacterium]
MALLYPGRSFPPTLVKRGFPGANVYEVLANAAAWDKSDYYLVYPARDDDYFSAPWWQGAGVTIIDEEGKTDFAQRGQAAANFIAALREFMPPMIDYDMASNLFLSGEASIIVNGPWYIAELEKAGIDYGIAPLPVFSATRLPATPFVGVKVLMLTKAAETRGSGEAAVNIMQYYTRAEAQSKLVEANKMIPAHRQVASTINLETLPEIAAFIDQATVGQPLPNTPFMNAMWEPITAGLECLWEGAEPTDACLMLIQTQGEENIAAMKAEMK